MYYYQSDMDEQEDDQIKDVDTVGDVVLDRNQLLLPIRLYVNTTRISEMSHDDVIAGIVNVFTIGNR